VGPGAEFEMRSRRMRLLSLVLVPIASLPYGLSTAAGLPAAALPLQTVTVAAGNDHSAVLQPDGSLWTFGGNWEGQLGTSVNFGSVIENRAPRIAMTGAAAVATGSRLPSRSSLTGPSGRSVRLCRRPTRSSRWSVVLRSRGK
jgi:alpha-tubulin suppressor-like RCC1 family protein